uniref:Uncharacterized protein n=1 Tax=Timema poppense TaxID=170557 RepID=A0A7R9CXA3_TIMPO|nr:unnamed protein product [Timema poppensis]
MAAGPIQVAMINARQRMARGRERDSDVKSDSTSWRRAGEPDRERERPSFERDRERGSSDKERDRPSFDRERDRGFGDRDRGFDRERGSFDRERGFDRERPPVERGGGRERTWKLKEWTGEAWLREKFVKIDRNGTGCVRGPEEVETSNDDKVVTKL